MINYKYTKTSFKEPRIISEIEYLEIKENLIQNPQYDISFPAKSFSEQFSTQLIGSTICGVVMIIGFSMGEGVPTMIGGLSLVLFLSFILSLISESPSYSTFLKDREIYFERLRSAVLKTNSYKEFVSVFFNYK